MKIICTLISTFLFSIFYTQNIDMSKIIAMYDCKMKIGHNNEKQINYALLIGDGFSFSSAESLLDKFSNYKVDRTKIESNMSYIEDAFYFRNNIYSVFGNYMDNKISYQESSSIRWNIHTEKKIIEGINCQKATATKYGREWTAYFSLDHNLPYGPYKFNGLPGLIIEIYDSKNDYQFHLKSLQNTTYKLSNNLSIYKLINKDKYFETVHNLKYTIAPYPPFEDLEFKKQIVNRLENLKKSENNPIELQLK